MLAFAEATAVELSAADLTAELAADLGQLKCALKVLDAQGSIERIDRPGVQPVFRKKRKSRQSVERADRNEPGAEVIRRAPRFGVMGKGN